MPDRNLMLGQPSQRVKKSVDVEAAAFIARVGAAVELARDGHRGHVDRLAALRRAGRVADQTYFQALEREDLS